MQTSISEIASQTAANDDVLHLFRVVNNVPQQINLRLDFEKLCDPATTKWDSSRHMCVSVSGPSHSGHCAPGTVPVATVCKPSNQSTTGDESAIVASLGVASHPSVSAGPSNLSPMPSPAPSTPIDEAIQRIIDTVQKKHEGVSGLSFDASNVEKAIQTLINPAHEPTVKK